MYERPKRTPTLRHAAPFLGVGVLFGLSYISLFEAYYRGRVTVVSPLVATESLWGVALSVLLLRRSELVGRRLALGALLVVAAGHRRRADADPERAERQPQVEPAGGPGRSALAQPLVDVGVELLEERVED